MPIIRPGIFIGIDPGASGAIAAVTAHGMLLPVVRLGKGTPQDAWRGFGDLVLGRPGSCRAALEQVGGYVKGNPTPGSAMFAFGRSAGRLEGFLIAVGIPFELVTPQKWQKTYALRRGKGEPDSAFKRRGKEIAQRLFPDAAITADVADAVLIAEHLRRAETGRRCR